MCFWSNIKELERDFNYVIVLKSEMYAKFSLTEFFKIE